MMEKGGKLLNFQKSQFIFLINHKATRSFTEK